MCVVSCVSAPCRLAEEVTDGSQYFVLLMITDGVISDMVQTKEAVVNVRAFHLLRLALRTAGHTVCPQWDTHYKIALHTKQYK